MIMEKKKGARSREEISRSSITDTTKETERTKNKVKRERRKRQTYLKRRTTTTVCVSNGLLVS